MLGEGKNAQGRPVFINQSGNLMSLKRIPLQDRLYDESWLQNILDVYPNILPIHDIEPFYSALISLGREIETRAGFIDNLFINPDGYLTLVETKLWRNPEARREVVGQIIDYAKEMVKLSFTSLDDMVRKIDKNKKGIIEKIKEVDPSVHEHEIIERINKNLKRGRFLLLIVGDGIRESVEDMIHYLTTITHLDFTLALIELRVYQTEDQGLLVIPNTLTRTVEIGRTIVSYDENSKEVMILPEPEKTVNDKKLVKGSKLNYDEYIARLSQVVSMELVTFITKVIDDFSTEDYQCEFGKDGVIIQYNHPDLDPKLTLFVVKSSDGAVFLATWLTDKLEKNNLPKDIGEIFLQDASALLTITVDGKAGLWNRKTTIATLKKEYERFKGLIEELRTKITKEINR